MAHYRRGDNSCNPDFRRSGGIEKINKVMMPAFLILFLIIAVRVLFLPGALEGYKYLLVPQWEYLLNPRTWIMAMDRRSSRCR